MNKKIVFLDMDGVIADMINHSVKMLGFDRYHCPPGERDVTKWTFFKGEEPSKLSKAQFWGKIDSLKESFWGSIPKYSWSDELVDLCMSKYDTYILSSQTRDPFCLAGKSLWIRKNYKSLLKKIILTKHKHLCAGQNRLLVDDTETKINKFMKNGGKGILFPREWNFNYDLAGDPMPIVRLSLSNWHED